MIAKSMAVLRTVVLGFLLFYTLKNLPIIFGLPDDFNELLRTCKASFSVARNVAWLAMAWIAFETVVGWWLATRRAPPPPAASAPPPAAPASPR